MIPTDDPPDESTDDPTDDSTAISTALIDQPATLGLHRPGVVFCIARFLKVC